MYRVISVFLSSLEKELNIVDSQGYQIVGVYPESFTILNPNCEQKFTIIYKTDKNFTSFR